MALRGLNVFVNIGAKVSSSVGASASAVERRLAAIGKRVALANAEAKAASRGLMSSGDIRGAAFDIAAIGYGFYQATKPAVEFEDALTRLGNTGEVYGASLKALGERIINTGKSYGLGGREALTGVEAYVAAGLTLDKAVAALGTTLKFSRTLGIDATEGAAAGVGVMNNMGVSVDDLGKAFDRMALAGKRGNFEVDAMAKYMPRLTSAAMKMGMTGVDGVGDIASMLQIVRKGSADEETAQNNLYNLFEKTFSAETVKKFKKAGYDLTSMYAESRKTGKDYFDMILDAVEKLSKKGENPFAFASTFEDQQAKSALTMLVSQREEYRKLRDEVRKAGDVIGGDWTRVNGTAAARLSRMTARIEDMAIKFGSLLLPSLEKVVNVFGDVADGMANLAAKAPVLANAIVGVTVALGGLVVGAKVVSIVATAVSRLGIALRWLGTVVGLGGGLAGLVSWFRGAALAMSIFAAAGAPVALIAIGIAGAIVALGAAIVWVISKWDGIVAFFKGFGEGFTKALAPFKPQLDAIGAYIGPAIGLVLAPFRALIDVLKSAAQWFGKFFEPADVKKWGSAGEAFGGIIGNMVGKLAELIGKMVEGRNAIRDFFAMANPALSAGATVGALAGQAVTDARPKKGPAYGGPRAYGGTVEAGKFYTVGERGRELFAPGRTGTIVPARTTAALLGAGRAPTVARPPLARASRARQAAVAQQQRAAAPVMPAVVQNSMVANGGARHATFSPTININGSPNPAATAAEVERVLKRMAREQRGLLSD